MHKFSPSGTFPKLRPIISPLGTFNYDLAHFLSDLLSPVVPDDYSCKDSFSFVSQIKNANLSSKFLVSCNVTSLFINIPLQETSKNLEKQVNLSIVFLDVFISGIDNQTLTLQTYTGLLLNFKSFTSFSYKISLIKCLILVV